MTDLEERAWRRKVHASIVSRVFWIALAGLVVAIVVLQLTTTLQTNRVAKQIAEQQTAGAARGRDIKGLAQDIRSCTSPSGACNKRNRQQTGSAISSINEITIAAAACAKQPGVQSVDEIRVCVERTLKATQIARQRKP